MCACALRQRPHNVRLGNDGAFAYDAQGLLAGEETPPIFECNAACGCGPEVRARSVAALIAQCINRVVGRGRTAKLDLGLTANCGWGAVDHTVRRG